MAGAIDREWRRERMGCTWYKNPLEVGSMAKRSPLIIDLNAADRRAGGYWLKQKREDRKRSEAEVELQRRMDEFLRKQAAGQGSEEPE